MEKFVTLWLPIILALGALLGWSLNNLEKRMVAKAEAKQTAVEIGNKLKSLEERCDQLEDDNKELKSDLHDVRKDFAQFVQKMLFNNKVKEL